VRSAYLGPALFLLVERAGAFGEYAVVFDFGVGVERGVAEVHLSAAADVVAFGDVVFGASLSLLPGGREIAFFVVSVAVCFFAARSAPGVSVVVFVWLVRDYLRWRQSPTRRT